MDEGIKYGIIFLVGALVMIAAGFYYVGKKFPKE